MSDQIDSDPTSTTERLDRRTLIGRGAVGAGVLGMSGGLAWLAGRTHRGDAAVVEAVVETGAGRARKLAVAADGRIVVAADRRLLLFSRTAEPIDAVDLPRPARCIAFGGDTLFVGLMDRVLRFDDLSDPAVEVARFDRDTIVAGLAVDGDDLFVADAGLGVVHRLDRDGRPLARIVPQSGRFHAPAEFFSLSAGDGLVHVAHPERHRVESFTADGRAVATWGHRSRTGEGFAGCCNPVGLALAGGRGFVTAERGTPSIKLFDPHGTFVRELAGPERFPENARAATHDDAPGCTAGGLDVAVDPTGESVLVLDRVTGRLHRLSV